MTQRYDVAVIGSGPDELAAAALLGRGGLRVLVLEGQDAVGGPAVTEEFAPGFRCDTLLHDLGRIPSALLAELELERHGLTLAPAGATVFAPAEGRALLLSADGPATAERLRGFSAKDAGQWERFTGQVARFTGFLGELYAAEPLRPLSTRAGDLFGLLAAARRLRALGKSEMVELLRVLPMSAADFLDDWFESDLLKGALGGAAISHLFQGPRSAGTAFVLLHHQVGNPPGTLRARTVARGGIGAVTAAFAAAVRAAGGEIRTSAPVERIVVQGERATSVVLRGGEEIPVRVVASGADARRTFLQLIDPTVCAPEFLRAVRSLKCRGVVAKVNLALGELPRFAGATGETDLHGVIAIGPALDYLERAFDDAKHGRTSRRPCLEAVIPSLRDPSLAPAGRHVMSVQVQFAPYHLKEGHWDEGRRRALGDLVVATLSEYAPNLAGAVLGRQVLVPHDFESRLGYTEGQLYQGELTLDQIMFMRPVPGYARYATPIEGLYLCGPGTHPGGGQGGQAGANAARRILRDFRQ